jgi:hypothetical protein
MGLKIIVRRINPQPLESLSIPFEELFYSTEQKGFSKSTGPGKEKITFILYDPVNIWCFVHIE